MTTNDEDLLTRISNYLIINLSLCGRPGLLDGQMGGAIFFYHYSQRTGKKYYADYADMMVANILENIDPDSPIGFASGLSGIGWGVEYIVSRGFVEGDTDEILEVIDRKIMQYDPTYITDADYFKGLAGIAKYITARLHSENRSKTCDNFPMEYLNKLFEACSHSAAAGDFPADLLAALKSYLNEDNIRTRSVPTIEDLMYGELPGNLENINLVPLGINKGLTGVVLKMILP